jgi:hypothetical protein
LHVIFKGKLVGSDRIVGNVVVFDHVVTRNDLTTHRFDGRITDQPGHRVDGMNMAMHQ